MSNSNEVKDGAEQLAGDAELLKEKVSVFKL